MIPCPAIASIGISYAPPRSLATTTLYASSTGNTPLKVIWHRSSLIISRATCHPLTPATNTCDNPANSLGSPQLCAHRVHVGANEPADTNNLVERPSQQLPSSRPSTDSICDSPQNCHTLIHGQQQLCLCSPKRGHGHGQIAEIVSEPDTDPLKSRSLKEKVS